MTSRPVPAALVTRNSPLRWITVEVEPAFWPTTNELVNNQKLVPIIAWMPPPALLKKALALVRVPAQVTGINPMLKSALSAESGTPKGDQLNGFKKSPPAKLVKE